MAEGVLRGEFGKFLTGVKFGFLFPRVKRFKKLLNGKGKSLKK